MPSRSNEMSKIQAEVGVAYGVPGGMWDVFVVEIPAVAEELIESYAIEKAKKELRDINAAGFWLHCYENIDEESV